MNLNATLFAQILHFFLPLGLVLLAVFLICRYYRGEKRLPRELTERTGNWNVSEDARCLRCNAKLELLGPERFRCGGTSGGWKLIFGEWAELGEQMMPLEVWACPCCRRVELRVPVQE